MLDAGDHYGCKKVNAVVAASIWIYLRYELALKLQLHRVPVVPYIAHAILPVTKHLSGIE